MEAATITVKLSTVAGQFMRASLDLLRAVEHADSALITDGVLAAAERLRQVVDDAPGEL